MATLTAGSAGINMAAFGTANPIGAPTLTTTAITATLPNGLVELYNGNYTLVGSASGALQLSAGITTAYELDPPASAAPATGGSTGGSGGAPVDPYVYSYAAAANAVYSISGANVSAAQMNQILTSKDLTVLLKSFLPGGDTYVGSAVSDTLVGQGGRDTFISGGGTETFVPASGANTVTGGRGIDTVTLAGASSAYTMTKAGGGVTVTDSVATRNGTVAATGIENLVFTDKTVFVADPDQANVARLYSAAFNRAPDMGGLNFWENIYSNNVSASDKAAGFTKALAQTTPTGATTSIANSFITSGEFTSKYGNLDVPGYITTLYQNVLGRAPDAGGLSFWTSTLAAGSTRADVLVGFAESPENISKVAAAGWLFLT